MKKLLITFVALAMTMAGLLTYTLVTIASELNLMGNDSVESVQSDTETDYYMVQFEDNEFLYASPIDSTVEGEMILDKKYKLGDIVKVESDVEYGDIISEELVTGKELDSINDEYAGEIDYLMDKGEEYLRELEDEEKIMAEDGSLVPVSYYE
jgi:hypothetical protein